jgi:DNA-directed RNA polymerase I subunit RPA2
MTRDQLVVAKEESTEFGGYFVCNGIERIIRMLVLQRRHYIMGLKRGAYLKRGANYTPWATMIRCVRPDQSSATVRLHYLADGGVNFAFTMRKAEYFIPVGILLKCFVEVRSSCAGNLMPGVVGPWCGQALVPTAQLTGCACSYRRASGALKLPVTVMR